MWLLKPEVQLIGNSLNPSTHHNNWVILSSQCTHAACLYCSSTEVPLTPTYYCPPGSTKRVTSSLYGLLVLVQTCPFSTFDEHTLYTFSYAVFWFAETQRGIFPDWKTKLCLKRPFCRITIQRPQGASSENAWRMKDGNEADVRWKERADSLRSSLRLFSSFSVE